MALLDVKEYYLKVLGQYTEMKADLADFEKALRDGFITEEKLNQVKLDVEALKINKDRLAYIMYLFELPKTKHKKIKQKKQYESLTTYFSRVNADTDAVIAEDVSVLDDLRVELKKIKNDAK